VIVLHEPLTATLVSGAVICIAGVAVTQIRSFTWRITPVAASVSAGRPVT
jgi:O-acetylserine/cysteine efflux transporter